MGLESYTITELVEELSNRDGVTKYPKWVERTDVFKYRSTLPGNKILLEVVVD